MSRRCMRARQLFPLHAVAKARSTIGFGKESGVTSIHPPLPLSHGGGRRGSETPLPYTKLELRAFVAWCRPFIKKSSLRKSDFHGKWGVFEDRFRCLATPSATRYEIGNSSNETSGAQAQ